MNRIILLLFLVAPGLTFAQLSKKDKKEIKTYTTDVCECVSDLINSLDPKAVEYMTILFEEGDEKANDFLTNYITSASEEEANRVNASFTAMSADSFGLKIEECDDKGKVNVKIARDIDNQVGEPYEYFLQMLDEGKSCFWLKNFYLLGNQ